MGRQLVTINQAKQTLKQHKKPCSDCPWARTALKGWLANLTPDEWLQLAHGESRIECHTRLPWQCAGAAIYRSNVCKNPRDKTLLILPTNSKLVFNGPLEFIDHHTSRSKT